MSLFNKKSKKISSDQEIPFYIVGIYENEEDIHLNKLPQSILSITSSEDEATEYLQNYVVALNYEHLTNWAEIHNKDIEDDNTVFEYIDLYLKEHPEICIFEAYYTLDRIASIFRMFNKCAPMGCSFETPVEIKYYINYIKDKNILTDEQIAELEEEYKEAKDLFDNENNTDLDTTTIS